MTIQESIEHYIQHCSTRLSAKTIGTYKGNLLRFANWIGKCRALQSITNHEVTQFQLHIQPILSPKTQVNYANTLRTFFKHWHAYRQSPVAWELIKGPRVPERLPNTITPEQFARIDSTLNEMEYYQLTKKVIFHLLWNTGMRIGELLSLNIQDISSTEPCACITTEKSKKLRIVMWNQRCHELLLR